MTLSTLSKSHCVVSIGPVGCKEISGRRGGVYGGTHKLFASRLLYRLMLEDRLNLSTPSKCISKKRRLCVGCVCCEGIDEESKE